MSSVSVVQELHYTKQRLHHTIEEHQTVNEELKSTNEELQSTNEELQSTNEELETSKEELQSLNEELLTVNAELQGKNTELSEANDDLDNLFNSLEIATIFLDHDLNIKRFTPHAKRVAKLIPSDVGRPLADIVSIVGDEGLIEERKSRRHRSGNESHQPRRAVRFDLGIRAQGLGTQDGRCGKRSLEVHRWRRHLD